MPPPSCLMCRYFLLFPFSWSSPPFLSLSFLALLPPCYPLSPTYVLLNISRPVLLPSCYQLCYFSLPDTQQCTLPPWQCCVYTFILFIHTQGIHTYLPSLGCKSYRELRNYPVTVSQRSPCSAGHVKMRTIKPSGRASYALLDK